MAKTPSSKLFQLIKTLTPAEKRYFKIFVRGKTDRESKYVQLFELMDAAVQFEDDKWRKKIYKSQEVAGKKYPELKAYLYDLVLKCLQSYDEQQSIEYRLNHHLQSVSVLFKRAMYDDCDEILQKALKLARQYESFKHELEILRWEKQLAYTRMEVDFLQKELERLHFEESKALEKLQNLVLYRQSFFSIYTTIRAEALRRGENRLVLLRNLIQNPLFVDADRALSFKARVMYYRGLNLYHYATQEQDLFYETAKQLIQLIESQPHFLKESLADYIASLSNLILSCGLLQKYDEVRFCLEKLRNLTPITEDDRRKIHRQYYTNKFVLCIYTGEFEEGRRVMNQHLAESATLDPQEYETASFYFQYCCICFGCGDFDRALDFLNEWLRQPRTVEREDLQSVARILSLIIHYEKAHFVLLESLLRSATRYLQKKNRLFDLERRFIQFMSELLKAATGKDKMLIFKKIKSDLSEIADNHDVQSMMQTFDLNAWLESKIIGQSFAENVRAKLKERTTL